MIEYKLPFSIQNIFHIFSQYSLF